MKQSIIIFSLLTVILNIAACSSSKKRTTAIASVPSKPVPPSPAAAPSQPFMSPPPILNPAVSGIFSPGNEELAAIQTKYKDVTMETLKEGYTLYVGATCTKCHEAKYIYTRPEVMWLPVLDNMAIRSGISNAQRDAIYKYVLAIKATQPKEVK